MVLYTYDINLLLFSFVFHVEMWTYSACYLGELLLFVLARKNKGAMTRLAKRLGARHKMAARHERRGKEDKEMKPEPTMAGENENAATGVGLERGFHMHGVNVVQIFNSRTY